MKKEEWDEYESRVMKALVEFVERATKSGATPGEVEALPGVAETLYRMFNPC